MTVYADYNFYVSEYLSGKSGAVTSTDFSYYARKASVEIDRLTFGNINSSNVPEAVKLCCCEIAELLCAHELTEKRSGGVSSESVQGWSKSFESSEARKNALSAAVRGCVTKWLGSTGLLYSGVRLC